MLNELKLTWKNFHNKMVAVPALLDILFIIAFGFFFNFTRDNIAVRLDAIMQMISDAQFNILAGQYNLSGLMATLRQLPGFTEHFNSIVLQISVFLAILYILWILMQGTSWFICYKLNKKNFTYNEFMKSFSLKTLVYYIIFVILTFFTVRIAISRTLLISPEAGESAYTVLYILLGILSIFLLLTYSNIFSRFKDLFNDIRKISLMYLIAAILYLAGHYILGAIEILNYTAMVVAGIVFFMPLLVYIKMFMINVMVK